MGCLLAAFVLAASPLGAATVSTDTEVVGMCDASLARDDRAAAVREGVFTDRVIVRCTPATSIDQLAASLKDTTSAFGSLAAKWNVRFALPTFFPAPKDAALAARIGMDRMCTLIVPDGTDVRTMAREFEKLTGIIELAEVDLNGHAHADPNDALYPQQWALHNSGQVVNGNPGVASSDIHAPGAWDITTTLTPVIVAILDTGVSQSHPDLAGIQVPGINTATASTPTLYDDNTQVSHGTYCAGIAGAAFNNGIGVAGVAPNVRIMPVKVLVNVNLGSQTTCANGLIWAADHGARVASMSVGWGTGTTTFSNAIAYASSQALATDGTVIHEPVLMCASTGNTPGAPIGYPAAWPSIIAVGGTDNTDGAFSGGTTGVQMGVVAPASDVLCTCDDSSGGLNGYSLQTGTSMACPIVAGLAAFILGEEPSLTASQVRDIIQSTADDLGEPGWDSTFGFGRVNALAAMQAAHRLVCPIDIDGNGHLDVYDIFAFVDLFFVQDPRADFNHSGSTTLEDIFRFLDAYLAGGC